MMKLYTLLTASLLMCLGALAADSAKPNILLIVSDDQGYADVGFQGSKEIPTPNLDQLARSGLRCTSGYVTHSFCSPTRAGLMTGRYQQRFGHFNNPVYDPLDEKEGLPLSERLLPEYLRKAGWTTGWIGKWHLGASPAHTPQRRGFDETFGFIGGGHRYLNWEPNGRQYTLALERNGQPVSVTNHLTAALGQEAAAYIRRHTDTPWFLYLAFNAPHTPHEPTPERARQLASIQDPLRRNYAAQVTLLDDAIGEIMTALAGTGQRERTLVFFFSDNGGPVKSGAVNLPLRGGKGQLYEGGVRVPFLVSWPGRLPAGKDYSSPVISLDVAATAMALANLPLPQDRPLDGVNLLPYLTGETKPLPQRPLFWTTANGTNRTAAVREGQWKLVRLGVNEPELYDLSTDVSESRNLASEKPEVKKHLVTLLNDWQTQLVPPAFPGSSVKNEDWGPGGANQLGKPQDRKQKQKP